MDFEGISPVGSSVTAPCVDERPQSGRRGNSESQQGSNADTQPEQQKIPQKAVEFSPIDPVIGAVLAEVTPGDCKKVAQKVKELLPD